MPDDLRYVEFETSEEVEVTPTFDSMGLRDDLLRGVYAYGNERFPIKQTTGQRRLARKSHSVSPVGLSVLFVCVRSHYWIDSFDSGGKASNSTMRALVFTR